MNRLRFSAACVLALTFLFAHALCPRAYADTVYGILAVNYLESFNPITTNPEGYFNTPSASSVAVGDGSIYVSSGTTLTRYDSAGDVLAFDTLPAGYNLGGLAFGNDAVYGILAVNYLESFNPITTNPEGYFNTPSASGVAVGDGSVYVSSGTTLTRYDSAGDVLAFDTLPAGYNLTGLAFETDTPPVPPVPEPASFFLVGTAILALRFIGKKRFA
jgi:hypothetical protein